MDGVFQRRGCLVVALVAVLAGNQQAEIIGPGTRYGHFGVDRWGQKVFHAGPYHLFVSDVVAEQRWAGESEVFAYERTARHRPLGAMSKRIAFRVGGYIEGNP